MSVFLFCTKRQLWLHPVATLGLLLGLFATPATHASSSLKITTFKSSGLALVTIPILEEAYERLGKSIEVLDTYGERALALADKGYNDGVAGRTTAIEAHVKNLIRVPTPVFNIRGVAFLKRRDIPTTDKIHGFTDYKIVTMMGYKNAIRKTEGMNRVLVPEFHHALRMVDRGHVDVALMTLFDGLYAIKKYGIKSLYVMPTVFANRPIYHYLHKRHEVLVKPLAEVLSEMKNEGRFDFYEQRAREALLITPEQHNVQKTSQ